MPIPNTKVYLSSSLSTGGAVQITPAQPGDFQLLSSGIPAPSLASATTDMNGDGRADLIFGHRSMMTRR